MLRFAINLLWARPGKVGGTEPFIRNLIAGMEELEQSYEAVLICSRDNAESFQQITVEDARFTMIIAEVDSSNIAKRILWQNLHLNALLRQHQLWNCFSPVYDRPVMNGKISYINVIHDIQAYHYPQYHPLHEVVYSKLVWKVDRDKSKACVCISNFVRDDIVKVYNFKPSGLSVIYNPVAVNRGEFCDFKEAAVAYGVAEKAYYYTVGQLIPHKNIGTLLKVMKKIAEEKLHLPQKLLISGINGNAADEIRKTISKYGLEEHVILTGYVRNDMRNTLYRGARAFLFPSVFEGFGIPPIEAMMCGTTAITTKCACIPEVTQEKAVYVNDPFSVDEWIEAMTTAPEGSDNIDWQMYDRKIIAEKYLRFLTDTWTK